MVGPEHYAAAGGSGFVGVVRAAYFSRVVFSRRSGGKQKAISGQQVGELFDTALVFANALLSGIDKSRLKHS